MFCYKRCNVTPVTGVGRVSDDSSMVSNPKELFGSSEELRLHLQHTQLTQLHQARQLHYTCRYEHDLSYIGVYYY